MSNKIRQYMTAKRFGFITLAAVAFAFMLSGLGMAGTIHWKRPSQSL